MKGWGGDGGGGKAILNGATHTGHWYSTDWHRQPVAFPLSPHREPKD